MACADLISLLLSKSAMATDQNTKNRNLDAIDCEQPPRGGHIIEFCFYCSLELSSVFAIVEFISSRMISALVLVCFGIVQMVLSLC